MLKVLCSKVLCSSLVIALLLSPAHGLARDDVQKKSVSKAELPTVSATVSAITPTEPEKTRDLYSLPDIVVSSTKTTVPARYAPFTTYTVDRKNIESQPSHSWPSYGQLVQDVPGVYVGQAPNKNPAWINLRGTGDFSARTLYLVDGLPLASSISFSNTINTNDIDRIDIVMGPSSALYGANASGGVVNVITRQGKKDMGALVSSGWGSNGANRRHVSVGDEVMDGNSRYHFYLSHSGDDSDGYQNTPIENALRIYSNANYSSYLNSATACDAAYDSKYIAGKFGWKGANGESLSLGYNWANLSIEGGQPNLTPLDDGKQGIGNLRYQRPIKDFMKITLTGGHQYWNRPAKSNTGISLDKKKNLVFNWTKYLSQQSIVQRIPVELQSDFYLGKNNVLTAGAFHCDEHIFSEADTWSTKTNSYSYKSSTDYRTDQHAYYLQDQAFFFDKKLTVLTGLRYDSWLYHDIFDSASTPQHLPEYSADTKTYRAGLKYQLNDELAIKTSAGTAYYPGIATWYWQHTVTGATWREPNPDLKPETTRMVDLGVEGHLRGGKTSFSSTAYYGTINDMYSPMRTPHPTAKYLGKPVQLLKIQNISKAEVYGLENQVNHRITDRLSATLNLTLNKSRIIEDPLNKGHQVANTPGVMANLGLKYIDPEVINGSLSYRSVSGQYYDNENTELPFIHMEPYQTVDLRVWRDCKLTKKTKLKVAFSVENLFDKDFAQEFIYQNPGRTTQVDVGIHHMF